MRLFGKQRDFEAFEEVIGEAKDRLPMRLLAWCAMPNHWHFVLWRRWRLVGVHALVDGHAYATLARGASHGGNRPVVPGTFQVVPDPRGRAFTDGAAVCGTEPLAGEHGGTGRGMAVVESVASGPRRRSATVGRRSVGAAARLAAARAVAADGGRVGGVAPFGGAGGAVWRGVVAGANGETIGVAIGVACPRSPVEYRVRAKIKTPDTITAA